MRLILFEGDGIFDLVRQMVDLHRQLEFVERVHHLAIKSRDRLGTQFQDAERAIAFHDPQLVFDEVETHFEDIVAVWDRGSRQTTRRQVKGDVPGVIDPWRERETNLADDLRPHVQARGGGLPIGERQSRPELIALLLGQDRKCGRVFHSWRANYATGKTVATTSERAYIRRSRRG